MQQKVSLFHSLTLTVEKKSFAPVNEILVISTEHCLPPSSSVALLCMREKLSLSLLLKEGNGTVSTKFQERLP